ncbi:PAS domain S-box-containing protein [Prosthecobacter debontii]|uniref:histidine kinase n=1 Tax=Prosthecobacter debontii TaxID=48467 RepID=A0A1T4YHB4_9BACT|nr:PAS domain-containing sensor histidine kinase [Prosthecobacter debontii]SKB00681.1 PAS domain S-box-containing protein [Prosthecobacter debontii]
MEWGTPALVFLAITLAVGGACLGFLKKRYHHTHHHLMVFVLVGAVGYLAPLRIQKKAQHEGDDLQQTWMGVSRTFAHALERASPQINQLTVDTAQPALMHVFRRLGNEAKDCSSAAVVVKDNQGTRQYHSLGLADFKDRPSISPECKKKIDAGFRGQEVWHEERGRDKDKPLKSLIAIVPLRDAADNVQGVLLLDFTVETWNRAWLMEQWRIVGEFSGLLIICVCLAGFLVVTSENRRRRELEKAIQPLMKDIESLDGMVNSVEGVVWERTSGSGCFTYLSQNADGYFGYKLEKWSGESNFLEQIVHSEDRSRVQDVWKAALKNLTKYQIEYRVVRADGGTAFVHEYGQAARLMLDGKVLRGILLDVTAQRESEATTQDMHKMMVQASRQAGMAEVATGVLHNVGNVLNSLNVGAKLLAERLKKSRLDKLCQATQLLKEHLPSDPDFFVNDKKGQVLPGYLADLSEYLRDEQNRLDAAVSDMIERIEHIRDMIMLQQSHSSVRTLWEPLDLATVMEEALRLETDVHITHQQVRVERHYADLPPIYSARGLLLQILVNLLGNACQAMGDKPVNQRILTLRILPQEDRVKISVEDTGCGIHPRHLTNIFTQGFTTKRDGHGFGLHHACLLAQDLGGTLKAESDGIGKGARFTLDIPARKDSKSGPFNPPNSLPASTLP